MAQVARAQQHGVLQMTILYCTVTTTTCESTCLFLEGGTRWSGRSSGRSNPSSWKEKYCLYKENIPIFPCYTVHIFSWISREIFLIFGVFQIPSYLFLNDYLHFFFFTYYWTFKTVLPEWKRLSWERPPDWPRFYSTLLKKQCKFPRYSMKCRGKRDTTVHELFRI